MRSLNWFHTPGLPAIWIIAAICLLEMASSTKAGDYEASTTMKILITAGQTVLTATMLDNATARDFMALMPITLNLKDYARTEKVADLPRKLSTHGAPAGSKPSVGDLTLYAPWGNLAIFYRDFGYASGLIVLGRIDHDVAKLSGLDGKARFEIIE